MVEDYSFLKSVYSTGKGFDGGENLLKCHAVVSESLSESDEAVLEHLGISLIEFKPKVDALFEVHVQPELEQWLDQMEENKIVVLQNLLNYSENKINISDYSEASFSRLTQFRR
ncbi:hypothetical protein [Marinilactibacillus sp. Marseille-P9653]|uniref:hypothetical protein n=1 Tax=Marinilactibacillus sp. Marseille-P9653 TaxID=2866583 RepID=UPI001CE464C8|nr:hypothetical protein [Marinilactibacillus sp. Marseille-P9653]